MIDKDGYSVEGGEFGKILFLLVCAAILAFLIVFFYVVGWVLPLFLSG